MTDFFLKKKSTGQRTELLLSTFIVPKPAMNHEKGRKEKDVRSKHSTTELNPRQKYSTEYAVEIAGIEPAAFCNVRSTKSQFIQNK